MNSIHFLATILCTLALFSHQNVFAHGDNHADTVPHVATEDFSAAVGDRPLWVGSASVALLERPIALFDGYGEAHFFNPGPANTSEEYVNLGFSALNVFHYADAFRAFRMAGLEDQNSIYAQVGLVFAVLEQDASPSGLYFTNLAFKQMNFIAAQRTLTAKETAWMNIAKAFYVSRVGTSSGLGGTVPTFAEAHRNLMAVDGQNPEALGYINWGILNNGNLAYIKQSLYQILATYPNHAGAHHYLLHIGEFENDMVTAVSEAEILITLSPTSAHAQHMYGHVLPQSGQWQKALDMFLIADALHHKWSQENEAALEEDWHYAHNLDLMAAAYLGLGDSQKALDTWTLSMPYDQRAIPKAIGLSLAMGDLQNAELILNEFESYGPEWVNFLKPLRAEYQVLSNPANPPVLSARPGSFDYLVKMTVELNSNPALETQIVSAASQYFLGRLTAGGFDGWSNGFVELLRLKTVATTFNATALVTALEDIEVRARAGTL